MNNLLVLDQIELFDTTAQVFGKATANCLSAVNSVNGRHLVNDGVL